MKKIIISGATSMLGIATIEAALPDDVEIYAVVRTSPDRSGRIPLSEKIKIVRGDLQSMKQIDGLPVDADVFYHFAWAGTNKADRDNPCLQEKNIAYTLDAIELAHRIGCKSFVYAGSQAEYGPVNGTIDENTKHAPMISYGIAKYAAGILGKKLCESYGIKHIWGRIFSIYGPHDNEGTMLDYAIKSFDRHESAHFSAATHTWNYLYESDAGVMFYKMSQEDLNSGIYLVASDKSLQLKQYIFMLQKAYGDNAEVEFAKEGEEPPSLRVDNSKTLEELQYIPKVPFEEGIARMIVARSTRAHENKANMVNTRQISTFTSEKENTTYSVDFDLSSINARGGEVIPLLLSLLCSFWRWQHEL